MRDIRCAFRCQPLCKRIPQGDCMKSRGRGPHWPAAAVGTRPVWQVRAWAIWALPRWLSVFIVGAVVLDAAGFGCAASGPLGDRHDLVVFGLLLACDVAGVELTRRAGEQDGIARDMHALWELPVALLLPLVYAPILPIVRLALTQWRGRGGAPHPRGVRACALGLSYFAAGLVFRAVGTHVAGLTLAGLGGGLTADPFRHGVAWMLAA